MPYTPFNINQLSQGGQFGVTPQFGLAAQANPFNNNQAANQYRMNLPLYGQMASQQSANTLSQLKGEIPQDVINVLRRQAAEFGISTGSPGGPSNNAQFLRNTLLTSIGQQEAGAKNYTQNIANTPVAEIWNPMSLYNPQVLGAMEFAGAQQAEDSQFGTTDWFSRAGGMWGPQRRFTDASGQMF